MTRRLFVLFSLSLITLSSSTSLPLTHSANQEPSAQDHTARLLHTLERMETIKPGMTRAELLKVFRTEGGSVHGITAHICPSGLSIFQS
jgi:hypothetical protein